MAKDCDIKIEITDGSIGKALLAAQDLDGFILYKNTHPINLTDEQRARLSSINRAKDLPGMGVYTDSGLMIGFDETYKIMREYIINYSLEDDFMGLFRILYGDDEEGLKKFAELQADLRDRLDKYFHIIENSETKETVQEYFFRLIRLIRDDEYNDIKLLLAIIPNARDAITFEGPFEALFKVNLTDPKDYLRIRRFLTKKANIMEKMPEFRIFKRNKGQSVTSHTLYSELPEVIKKYYFDQKFYIPHGITVTDLSKKGEERVLVEGDHIYVTNQDFLKFSIEDQEKLFNAIFEKYKLDNPNNAKKLESEIKSSVENFSKIHGIWNIISTFGWLYKGATNPVLYSGIMSLYGLGSGYVALLALNSFLHLPRYIANHIKGFSYAGDFGKFCETLGIFHEDVKFWDIIKGGYEGGGVLGAAKSGFLGAMLSVKQQMVKLAEAQFFNIADTAMTSYYRRCLVEEYISNRYPFLNSFDEYAAQLTYMGKEAREKEIKDLVKYVDDKMYTRYNNSADMNRYIEPGIIVPENINLGFTKIELGRNSRDMIQEVANVASGMWHFYRRYMESYTKSTMGSIKEGWKNGDSQKYMRELFEQYYNGEKTWAEVSDIVDGMFANNQDLEFVLNTAIYSALIANMVFKYDIHGNGYNEEYVDASVLLSEYLDLYKLFFFPIEAWQRTVPGMFLTSTFEAISFDASLDENADMIAVYNYKTAVKQLAKSQWVLRGFAKLSSDLWHNAKYERGELSTMEKVERAIKDVTTSIHSFGYFLKDDIERGGFEQYTPKTQSARLKDVFGVRPYSMKIFDEVNKKSNILEEDDLRSLGKDWWDSFWIYNTPLFSEVKIGSFSQSQAYNNAVKELKQNQIYWDMAGGNFPKNGTDDQYMLGFNLMTKYTPKNLDQIGVDFLVDWSWKQDDGNIGHDYNKEEVEKIHNLLMVNNVNPKLLKEAVRLLTTADKAYQGQALHSLLYLDAEQPGAGIRTLGLVANYEVSQEVFYSGKYGYFKRQKNGEYSDIDKARLQDAFRKEQIAVSKKYIDYIYTLDKESRAQLSLKVFHDSPLSIKDFIKDTNANQTSKLGIYSEPIQILEQRKKDGNREDYYPSSELMEQFLLQMYANMAMAEGNPDGFKMNNFASKLVSAVGRKSEDGKLTQNGKRAVLYSMNAAMEAIDNMGGSDVEKLVTKSGILSPHDQILGSYLEGMTPEEIAEDPVAQYTLRFIRGTTRDINRLGDRAVAETVQKTQVGTDPSDVSLSWATKSNGTKKSGYSNWKDYYNKHKPLYDKIKYMAKKYVNYKNDLYTPPKLNVGSYYSKKERDLKAFGPSMATIKQGSSRRRRSDTSGEQAGGSLRQNRGNARPFTNRGDLDKIPERKKYRRNRRTRGYAISSKMRNRLIPGRRRYIKQLKRDIPVIS